jgi:uncharacterized protein (TIGR02145 family)
MRSLLLKSTTVFSLVCMAVFQSCTVDSPEQPVVEIGSVTDIEGNTYKTVKIGNQWWTAENLRVTQFNDGSAITFIDENSNDTLWSGVTTPSYTEINNGQYGLLYNYAVVESALNIAPEGWHVATDEDWKVLEREVGMSQNESNALGWRGSVEAELLTAKNSAGWPEGAVLFGIDTYQFNAKPSGCRVFNGELNLQGNTSFWWAATTYGNEAWYRYFDARQTRIFRQHTYKGYGMSIRCVKNN